MKVDQKVGAKANCSMVHYCDKQVFAPHARFEVFLPIADRYVVGAEVLDVFKERLDFESPER